jgi:hypothetical protein
MVLVAVWRDKRWIAQTGILMDKGCSEERQETRKTPWKCKEKGLLDDCEISQMILQYN